MSVRNRFIRRPLVSALAIAALSVPFIIHHEAGAASLSHNLADAPKPSEADQAKAEATQLVAKVLDAIVSTDGLTGIDDTLAGKDRDRVDSALQAKHKAFAELATEFRADWKRKYDDQFDARTHTGVLSTDRVELAEHGSEQIARVFFNAHESDPAFELHLVREKSGEFRLNLPDSLTGDKLASRLETALKALIANKADWPKEESVGYAQLTRKLLHPMRWETLAADKKDDKPAKTAH